MLPDQYDALWACKTYEADCAFSTYDAVAAFMIEPDQYDAVATDIDDVWFESITFELFTCNDPVTLTDPVNWCVFANRDPLIEEPVT